MTTIANYHYFKGRALWTVVGHSKCKGILFCTHRICHDSAPTRYVTMMHRNKGGIKIRAIMAWY